MSENCTAYNFIPEPLQFVDNPFGACSNQGECIVPSETCECNDGWTGRSDFVNLEGYSCQINDLAIRILWGVYLFWLVLCIFQVRKEVWAKWEQHKDIREKKAQKNENFRIWDNRGMLAIASFLFLCAPTSAALGIIRIIKTDERVGLTPAVTILFPLAKLGLYSAARFFQPALLQTILKGQKNMKRLLIASDTMAFFNMVISTILGLLPLITLFASDDGQDDIAQYVWISYFGGSVISMLAFATQAFVVKLKVVKALNKSHEMTKNDNILDIRKRLVKFQDSIITQGSIQAVIYACFLFLPFLWGAHDYFLPISWLAMPILFKKLASSTVTTKKVGGTQTGTSSRSRSKEGFSESNSRTDNDTSFQQSSKAIATTNSFMMQPTHHSFVEKVNSYYESPEIGFSENNPNLYHDDDDEYV